MLQCGNTQLCFCACQLDGLLTLAGMFGCILSDENDVMRG